MNVEERVLVACEKHKQRMKEVSGNILPAEHGIYPSEMLCVCAICEELDVGLIVESGRQFGFSTHVLSEWFSDSPVQIVSIDIDPVSKEMTDRLRDITSLPTLIQGDGAKLIPLLVADSPNSAVLMDGPKYDIALGIAEEIIGQVKAIFIHDMAGLSCGSLNGQLFIIDDVSFG